MLRHANHLIGFGIQAVDGVIGRIEDFLFDDRSGKIRHLVIGLLGADEEERSVLVDPECVDAVDTERRTVAVSLSVDAVRSCPDAQTDPPVCRQGRSSGDCVWMGLPWGEGAGVLGVPIPIFLPVERPTCPQDAPAGDPHLRSLVELASYAVRAVDGWCGTVRGFLVDMERWAIREALVKTRIWVPCRKVLVPWRALKKILCDRMEVQVDMTRSEVRRCPTYDPLARGNTDYGVGITG